MINGWVIVTVALSYVGFLFAVAYFGDKYAKTRKSGKKGRPTIYALSLAVYCTSWTFFGSVGLATSTGFDFLAVYLGPIVVFAFGRPLIRRIIKLSQDAEYHVDCRLHRRALRQEPSRCGSRYRHRGGGRAALYRAAAQGGVALGRHAHSSLSAQRPSMPSLDPFGDITFVIAMRHGRLRHPVRHAPHRRHRASGRADAGHRHGVGGENRCLSHRRHRSSPIRCSTASARSSTRAAQKPEIIGLFARGFHGGNVGDGHVPQLGEHHSA